MKFFEIFRNFFKNLWIFFEYFWKFFANFLQNFLQKCLNIFWKFFWKSLPPPEKNPGYADGINYWISDPPRIDTWLFRFGFPASILKCERTNYKCWILSNERRYFKRFNNDFVCKPRAIYNQTSLEKICKINTPLQIRIRLQLAFCRKLKIWFEFVANKL